MLHFLGRIFWLFAGMFSAFVQVSICLIDGVIWLESGFSETIAVQVVELNVAMGASAFLASTYVFVIYILPGILYFFCISRLVENYGYDSL